MVRRYMPTYRKSKKVSSVARSDEKSEALGGGENKRQMDRIAPAQWKQENSTRCQSASLARMVSERLRSESVWLMKEVGQTTERAQKDSNFRLEEKLRDTNNWRGELQAEADSLAGETELLIETRHNSDLRDIRVFTNGLLIYIWGERNHSRQCYKLLSA